MRPIAMTMFATVCVLAADIARFCLYRGQKCSWAGEGNEWHPTYTLSLTMGEMVAPVAAATNARSRDQVGTCPRGG
jgi:hypothetical protein